MTVVTPAHAVIFIFTQELICSSLKVCRVCKDYSFSYYINEEAEIFQERLSD